MYGCLSELGFKSFPYDTKFEIALIPVRLSLVGIDKFGKVG